MTNENQIAHHELAHQSALETQGYLKRGRQMHGLALPELEKKFVSAVKQVALDEHDNRSRLEMNDALAEYGLRRVLPPYHLIRQETEIMAERGRARLAEMTSDERQRIEAAIQARYADANARKQ